MKIIFLLIVLSFAYLHLSRSGIIDPISLPGFSKSKQELHEELVEKMSRRQAVSNGLASAQANAGSCGGRQRIVQPTQDTIDYVQNLDKEIAQLRVKIAQK